MTIDNLKPQLVAYIRRVGPYGPENYAVMDALKSWAWGKGLLAGGTIYGIAYDNPGDSPEQCRFDACVAIPDENSADGSVQVQTLAGGAYAVFAIEHTADAVEAFWNSYLDAIDSEGLLLDDARPIVERYRESMIVKGMCEFCVPVK